MKIVLNYLSCVFLLLRFRVSARDSVELTVMVAAAPGGVSFNFIKGCKGADEGEEINGDGWRSFVDRR